MSPSTKRLILLLLLLAGLAAGLVAIFRIRLGAGDVFPVYSTYRSDPLGTRLLYESLSKVEGLKVERSHEPLHKFAAGRPPRTLVLAGLNTYRWAALSDKTLNALNAAVLGGDRLVVVFEPSMVYGEAHRMPYGDLIKAQEKAKKELEAKKPKKSPTKEPSAKGEEPKKAEGDSPKQEEPKEAQSGEEKKTADERDFDEEDAPNHKDWEFGGRTPSNLAIDQIERLWGIDLWGRWIMDKDAGALRSAEAPEGFEASLPWKSGTYFVPSKGTEWTVLYTRGTLPVMVELKHGKGSLVFATDAHFISNEALQEQPALEVLSWLPGETRTVVFDEWHLGLEKSKGVAALARRYGMAPAAGLLLLAGLLYVWRQVVRFVPPPPESDEVALEFHPTAGMEALLRRAVPRKKLFEASKSEWKKHARPGDIARVEGVAQEGPIASYNAALRSLRRGKVSPPKPFNTNTPSS